MDVLISSTKRLAGEWLVSRESLRHDTPSEGSAIVSNLNWLASVTQIQINQRAISAVGLSRVRAANVAIPPVRRFQSRHALLLMCPSSNTAN